MNRNPTAISQSHRYTQAIALAVLATLIVEPFSSAEPSTTAPQFIPQPAPATSAPYQPQAIAPGGIVVPLYPADSPFLKTDRIREAEVYTMNASVPGRINSIVNIHNPSIEFHPAAPGTNTGAAIILLAGGGHKRLVIGSEGTDLVPFFFNYGINCVILRYRLRDDGYNAEIDAVNDTQQAIRLVRSRAGKWNIDPHKIGVMGFSAGGEPASASALFHEKADAINQESSGPLAGVSSRPDFVGLIYTGPTALTKNPDLAFPRGMPPVFIAAASYGDARHTVWAMDYYMAMLKKGVPNIEVHLYGNGGHGGGLSDRHGIPFGTWHHRFIEWFRDLGFLGQSGVPTKAAADIETALREPQPDRK